MASSSQGFQIPSAPSKLFLSPEQWNSLSCSLLCGAKCVPKEKRKAMKCFTSPSHSWDNAWKIYRFPSRTLKLFIIELRCATSDEGIIEFEMEKLCLGWVGKPAWVCLVQRRSLINLLHCVSVCWMNELCFSRLVSWELKASSPLLMFTKTTSLSSFAF